MNEMARFGKHLQLILPLHLANHQFLIQSIRSCEHQQFAPFRIEKLSAEAGEPTFPVWLCGCEVGTPGPRLGCIGRFTTEKGGHRDAGGDGAADCSRAGAVLDEKRDVGKQCHGTYCHSMPEAMEGKLLGLVVR